MIDQLQLHQTLFVKSQNLVHCKQAYENKLSIANKHMICFCRISISVNSGLLMLMHVCAFFSLMVIINFYCEPFQSLQNSNEVCQISSHQPILYSVLHPTYYRICSFCYKTCIVHYCVCCIFNRIKLAMSTGDSGSDDTTKQTAEETEVEMLLSSGDPMLP